MLNTAIFYFSIKAGAPLDKLLRRNLTVPVQIRAKVAVAQYSSLWVLAAVLHHQITERLFLRHCSRIFQVAAALPANVYALVVEPLNAVGYILVLGKSVPSAVRVHNYVVAVGFPPQYLLKIVFQGFGGFLSVPCCAVDYDVFYVAHTCKDTKKRCAPKGAPKNKSHESKNLSRNKRSSSRKRIQRHPQQTVSGIAMIDPRSYIGWCSHPRQLLAYKPFWRSVAR